MFTDYLEPVADAYSALLDAGEDIVPPLAEVAYEELAADSVDRAAGVRLLLEVIETDNPEPYTDPADMVAEIARGRFYVSRANSEHPVWSTEENVAFRIVHDVLGHYAASVANGFDPDAADLLGEFGLDAAPAGPIAGFDWEGENLACMAHGRLLATQGERMALFTECLAQTGFAIARGGFGKQVAGNSGPALTGLGDGVNRAYANWINGRIS